MDRDARFGLSRGESVFCPKPRQCDHCLRITSDLEIARLLDEVTLAKESAEEAKRVKSRFLAAVSHDRRQPLHTMGLFLESLRGRLQRAEQKELYGNISNALHALEDMFSSLLEISRHDSGSVTPSMTHFPLQALLHKLATEFSTEVEHKALSLQVSDTPHIVRSDCGVARRYIPESIEQRGRSTPTTAP